MKLMDHIWAEGRARGYGMTALMAVVVFGISATAADALRSTSAEQPAGEVFVAPPEAPAAATTSAPPAAPSPAPVALPAADAPAATVDSVTTPAPQAPAEEPAPAVVDPESVGSTGPDGNYTPAPPRINPGEPPLAPNWGSSGGGDVAPLPGEPGYTGTTPEPIPRS